MDTNGFEGFSCFLLSVEGVYISFYNSTCSFLSCSLSLSLYVSILICGIKDTIVMKTMKHLLVFQPFTSKTFWENNRIYFTFLVLSLCFYLYFKKMNEITLAATIFTILPGCCVPLYHYWFLPHAYFVIWTLNIPWISKDVFIPCFKDLKFWHLIG